MPATDALHVRTQLSEQLDNPRFRSLLDIFAESEGTRYWPEPQAVRLFGQKAFSWALERAQTFYVAPDMQELAQIAAQSFPDDEVILEEDQPSPVGFMYLPARFRMFELRGRVMVVHAILWDHNKFWLITDRNDPDDQISQEMRADPRNADLAELGRWDLTSIQNFIYGKAMPKDIVFDSGVLPIGATVKWERRGDSLMMHSDHPIDMSDGVAHKLPSPIMRLLLSIWRLMQQTLADVSETKDHPRATRRRAERKHVPTGVTVIQLRRRESNGHGMGEGINYRTTVSGHWRRVWCGEAGHKYQRAVFIHDYWRGPDDAPIIIRKRIKALTR